MKNNSKTVIYYFSGTGNNLYLAKKMQSLLTNTDIYPIHILQEKKEISSEYHNIVFCVPSYYSHIPPYVSDCIEGLKIKSNQKIISIVGCGGNRGHAIEDLRACVNKLGKQVDGEYMVIFPGSYILSYGAFPKGYQKIVACIADKKIKKIVQAIQENKLTVLKKTGLFYKEKMESRLQQAIGEYAKIAQEYEISTSCTGCGTCAQVCPVGNIILVDKRPEFLNQCQQCMACIQWCPNKAIDYQHKAQKRKRYHNQAINLKSMIQGNKGQ